jgi:PAS domain S-box-containing protein
MIIKDKTSYKILVIEDNPGDYALVHAYLEDQILSPLITHCQNYRECVKVLSTDNVEFDIVLLDLTLPDKQGMDLIDNILALCNDLPIIILTGFSNMPFSIKSLNRGISDYLLKDSLTAVTLYKSIVHNISRKEYIQALKESEKRYNNLFHLSPQPMWVLKENTLKILDANKAAIIKYGYSYEEFMELCINDLLPNKAISQRELDLNSDADGFKGVFELQLKDKKIIKAEVYSNTISLSDNDTLILLANDVSDKLNYIKAIEEQNKKLREISWTQSHTVRAPLVRMMGIIDLIKSVEKGDINSNRYELFLDEILNSATELDQIIRGISTNAKGVNID